MRSGEPRGAIEALLDLVITGARESPELEMPPSGSTVQYSGTPKRA